MTLFFLKISIISNFFLKKIVIVNKKNVIFFSKKKFDSKISFFNRGKNWKYYSNLYFYFSKLILKNVRETFFLKNIFYVTKLKLNYKINWFWEVSLGIFFILFGFFSATSAITIIGSVADWDPLAAAVMLCWTELFTKIFYFDQIKSFNFKLINISYLNFENTVL